MTAMRTHCHGAIHIFPCRSATKDVVDLFSLWMRLFRDALGNATRVRTCGAVKLCCGSSARGKSNLKECSVQWTEPHGAESGEEFAGDGAWQQ